MSTKGQTYKQSLRARIEANFKALERGKIDVKTFFANRRALEAERAERIDRRRAKHALRRLLQASAALDEQQGAA